MNKYLALAAAITLTSCGDKKYESGLDNTEDSIPATVITTDVNFAKHYLIQKIELNTDNDPSTIEYTGERKINSYNQGELYKFNETKTGVQKPLAEWAKKFELKRESR